MTKRDDLMQSNHLGSVRGLNYLIDSEKIRPLGADRLSYAAKVTRILRPTPYTSGIEVPIPHSAIGEYYGASHDEAIGKVTEVLEKALEARTVDTREARVNEWADEIAAVQRAVDDSNPGAEFTGVAAREFADDPNLWIEVSKNRRTLVVTPWREIDRAGSALTCRRAVGADTIEQLENSIKAMLTTSVSD